MALKPASTFPAMRTPIVDPKTGLMSWEWIKWHQDAEQRLQNGLNKLGRLIGDISGDSHISGRSERVAVTLQNLTSTGKLNSLLNVTADRNLDNIADTANFKKTTANDVQGAAVAYAAMIAGSPTSGNGLVFDGTTWNPTHFAFSQLTGQINPVTQQPASGAVAGSYTLANITVDAAGRVTAASSGATAGLTVTIATAKLTVGGANGSMTFTNGLLTAQVAAT